MLASDVDYLALARELGIKGRAAGNQLYARCPMHSERNPSFSLNTHTGAWTCHTEDTHGTFVQLVMYVNDVTATEAERWIVTTGKHPDNEVLHKRIEALLAPPKKQESRRQDTSLWSYYNSLDASVMPIAFLRRGFTWETIHAWGIKYDPVREQLVIPVYQWTPEPALVGLIYRNMGSAPGRPKYENSLGFAKHRYLFGLSPQIRETAIFLTEGPLDAIWLQQCGYYAVAVFGTELSDEQCAYLRAANHGTVILAFDNDEPDKRGRRAGEEGTRKAVNQLIKNGWLAHQIRRVEWPDGCKDANDCTPSQLSEILPAHKLAMEAKFGRH